MHVYNEDTTSVARALTRRSISAANALLDGVQVDSSPHLLDVVMPQMQGLVALFYQSGKRTKIQTMGRTNMKRVAILAPAVSRLK